MDKTSLIQILSPAYSSSIKGNTEIVLRAEGYRTVTAKCVKGIGDGVNTVVATVAPDAESGLARFVFPADEYPSGPIALLFYGERDGEPDICHAHYVNEGGLPWKAGAGALPPQCAGMELAFYDEFASPDLSINAGGPGARYYCHKPDGGDFSMLPFSDVGSERDPFSQVGSCLRIRADAAKNSAGLISSVLSDGSGFDVAAPCYFECRFLAPNAVGTWPAFWLLTNRMKDGTHLPTDELDTIEAYGLADLDHQNRVGYYVTSHRWNQDKAETTDPDLFIDMRSIGSGLLWNECFHTYGTLVTEEDTVYYCDDVEVFRHPTQPFSASHPLFFMINLAVGGNGWPVDLSRYGFVDMYVDFVRVFKG